MYTAWGYEIAGNSIPPLLSAEAFDQMTGGKYTGDARASAALAAASQAVRNACGWHVSPSASCTAHVTACGDSVRLPSCHVTAVSSVEAGGVAVEGYEWTRVGVVAAPRGAFPRTLDGVAVVYTAGFDAAAVPDLAMTVAGIVEGVMAVAPGVASESADGVSVSYSASASSVAASLTQQQLRALAPYRLVSSHAA